MLMAAPLVGGCSMPLGSGFGGASDLDITGSIASSVSRVSTSSGMPSEADLAYARAAATEVLAKGGKDASHPWENPNTGARGSVTPLTNAYSANGTTCRDFLASYVKDKAETWMQGEACKFNSRWEVRSLKPWRKA
ncbi:hypothetical protein X566_17220 [Afipia sp. P52-10]|jgi:surface antigen|nr:hypothetical protein X566_17220 [Afipia sp. P52-10]